MISEVWEMMLTAKNSAFAMTEINEILKYLNRKQLL